MSNLKLKATRDLVKYNYIALEEFGRAIFDAFNLPRCYWEATDPWRRRRSSPLPIILRGRDQAVCNFVC
jgi:hypothetical protein